MGFTKTLSIAVVSADPEVRSSAARAFDDAPVSWSVQLARELPVAADVIVFGPDCAAPGGIVFDPENPRVVIEQVLAAERGKRLIIVSSPSGGTGATSVALHLAAALGLHRRVCFVDLCIGSGASDRLAIPGGESKSWADAGGTNESLMLAALPVPGGFRALLAPRQEAAVDIDALLTRTAAAFDSVVVEARNDELLSASLQRPASAVMVVSPSPPGACRAKLMYARYPATPWVIVTNRLGGGGQTTKAGIEALLGRRIALELPCCPALRDAEDHGDLLTSRWTRWSRRVARLARFFETP